MSAKKRIKKSDTEALDELENMWSWDYRIFHKGDNYFIGEAYYDKNGKFENSYSSTDFNPLQAESVEELAKEHSYIMAAFQKPVIELDKPMTKCPKCSSENIVAVEYSHPNPERYDGVSEYQCIDCAYRQGRWTHKELPVGYVEPRLGRGGKPVQVDTKSRCQYKY